MAVLTAEQVAAFRRDGYLTLPGAVTVDQLAALRAQLAAWIEDSRGHDTPWGEQMDGRPRFDLAAAHRPDNPQLRRVNNPSEVSEIFRVVMADSRMTDMVADLIGPDLAFHHCKINLKLPGADTEVGWHQDFGYTPHSNDDLVTALLFLDDVTEENGALAVVPGSHLTGLSSLWDGGRFTGAVAEQVASDARRRAVLATGPAGSVCLMHTMLLHGSRANLSARSRNLYIAVYAAADAVPLAPSPVPSRLQGTIVRGHRPRTARLMGGTIELPPNYGASSFFEIQRAARGG
ncbi:MAG: phytanoyl-CoA dioxygenase family protein [Alphaproteobacteria bacterium]